jgi:hypothetical protein
VTEINGRVKTAEGKPDPDAIVIVFPADPQYWVEFGLNTQRFRVARSEPSSSFTIRPLPGDYYVIAVPEESASGWREARTLGALTSRATRVDVVEGDTRTIELVTVKLGGAGR